MSVMRRASPETMRAVRVMRHELAAHAGRRGDRLEVRYLSGWVAFRSSAANRAFAEIRPGKKGVEIFLLVPRAELRDAHGIAAPVPPSRGWGWFRTRAKIENGLSPAVAVDLLRQSYEYAKRMPRRRPTRSMRRA